MAQVNTVRTEIELKDPDYNYFIAFKIDLNENNRAKIEPKIKTVLGDPKGSVFSRRLLELKNDIFEIMLEDAIFVSGTYKRGAGGRRKEADKAKEFKLKEAVGIVEILCQTRKTLLKSEVLDIYTASNKPIIYFSEQEFFSKLSYLKGLGVNIVDNTDASIPFKDYMDTDQYLKAIVKTDLYSFLGIDSKASTNDITLALDTVNKSISKINDLKKKQSYNLLCSSVKKLLLSSKESRQNYDYYLKLKDVIWADFGKRKNFGVKDLNMDEYKNYTQRIIDILKISVGEAEKMLAIGCKFFRFTVVGKTDGNNLEYCPHPECGKLYVKGEKTCPHCGKSLEILCWNCKQKKALTKNDIACSTCGATQNAKVLFEKKCTFFDSLTNASDIDITAIQSALLDIKNVIPNYEKKSGTAVYVKIQEYEKVVQSKVKEEETIGSKYKDEMKNINSLISQKKYQTAFNLANSLQKKFGNYNIANTKNIVSQISKVINSAQSYLNTAKRYIEQRNEKNAIASAIQAINICDDLTEARQVLQKFPPKPVTNLKAVLNNNAIKLDWNDNSQQDFVTYTVIKKVGVAPVNSEDGALVANNLSIKFLEDESFVAATPYYYAVYAERYGTKSNICALNSPIIVYSDVMNIQQDIVSEGIKVRWETPQNIKAIEVWKNVGSVAPLNAGEGTRIDCDNKGFLDAKCSGENAYLILCKYQGKNGVISSKGVRVVYKPFEKTVPLENVKFESIGSCKYVFSCKSAYNGNVSLYYSNTKLQIQTNTVLKYIDFNTLCKGFIKINSMANADGNLTFSLPLDKICQVYAVVATEQLFIVSPPHLINTMSGMNSAFTVSDGTVSIRGNVHPKANNIVVKVSNSRYAETVSDCGDSFVFKTEELKKRGQIDIKLKSDTISYISVFVEFIEGGVKSYSFPEKLDPPIDYREPVNVLYTIDYKISQIKPFKVTVCFEADKEVEIPSLLLMKGSHKLMYKNSGELCERIAPIKLTKSLFSKKYTGKAVITVSPTSVNTKFGLFTENSNSYVRLRGVKKL